MDPRDKTSVERLDEALDQAIYPDDNRKDDEEEDEEEEDEEGP